MKKIRIHPTLKKKIAEDPSKIIYKVKLWQKNKNKRVKKEVEKKKENFINRNGKKN